MINLNLVMFTLFADASDQFMLICHGPAGRPAGQSIPVYSNLQIAIMFGYIYYH